MNFMFAHCIATFCTTNFAIFEFSARKTNKIYVNPIPDGGVGGEGGADSIRLQTVFIITSVRDAAEPQNWVTFPKI